MIECNDLYDYGLKIYQNSNYFKFSLDSILLAEFVKIKDNYNVLDLCTGNVPIPLVLCLKNKNIHIDAVEIQKEIYDLARKSILINHMENQISLYNCDASNFVSVNKYDVIICNPPYFKYNSSSLTNINSIKTIARHEVYLNFENLIKTVKKNLKENGNFYLVHRSNRLIEIIEELIKNKFGIRTICFIETSQKDNANLFLLEASKNKKSDVKILFKKVNNYSSYKNMFE